KRAGCRRRCAPSDARHRRFLSLFGQLASPSSRKGYLMSVSAVPRLTAMEIEQLDPYALMAVLGKRVIHPGGRRSTEELLARADLQSGQQVLDVGCGV